MSLLKQGIPYEVIMSASEEEISLLLGISAAYHQKENEDTERSMARQY
jgi:hypothetical protein